MSAKENIISLLIIMLLASFSTHAQEGWPIDTVTQVVEVTNPTTGKTWMDRNLGASRAATNTIDEEAYGDLYQWGRAADGHEKRNSGTTSTLSSSDTPGHGEFITIEIEPKDWRSPQNNNLWQGVNGINNPCPNGYRLPTEAEWDAERQTWSSNDIAGAITSQLKLPIAGGRNLIGGSLGNVGVYGHYWSSTGGGTYSRLLNFYSSSASMLSYGRAFGFSVRCLKDATSTTTATVTTTAITEIAQTNANSGGNITDNGGVEVTASGIVYSTSETPTFETNEGITTDGTGTGEYTSSLTGLTSGTTYYVRAYAANSEGTAYGQQESFTTLADSGGDETQLVEVTNPATGKTWMDRNLGASRAATSSADADAYGDLYQWGRATDGHEKRNSGTTSTLSSSDTPGHGDFILAPDEPNDWRSPQNDNLWQGVNSTNNPCPNGYRLPTEAEWEAERQSWSSNSSAGAFASPLKLPVAGYRYGSGGNSLLNVGSVGNYWPSTADGNSSRLLVFGSSSAYMGSTRRSVGGSVRCLKDATTATAASITTTAITDIAQTTANSGGNITDDGGAEVTARGIVYSINSTATVVTNQGITTDGPGIGVYTSSLTGLTAETTYYVRAYATNSEGTAYGEEISFTTLADNKSWPIDTVTQVVEVTNPATGKTWMDRNLGATRAATSSADAEAYGDLYQWGRAADGHEKRNSATTSALSTSNTPGHDNFILAPDSPSDWRSLQNDDLWQGVNETNNPCPGGYRLPTDAEWEAELISWSSDDAAGAFASPLKLPVAGYRYRSNGSVSHVGSYGYYWSSTVDGTYSQALYFYSSSASTAFMNSYYRASGRSVRCLKNVTTPIIATVTTTPITDIAQTTATGGGNITDNGGAVVTARGIVYSASENPTVATNQGITTDSIGTGQYASSLTGLTAATTYYVRAYATNSEGTAYGQQESFTTLAESSGDQTQVVEVTNPATGKTWMDRNLGASRAAISSTDADAYGDLYQWGRAADGHEKRNSGTTTTLSSNDTPGHGDFILPPNAPNDWRSPQNDNLWQGVNGTNNPCPRGYRLPTEAEWEAERQSWNSNDAAGAFASPLKLPFAGYRYFSNGSIYLVGSRGRYWSSTVSVTLSRYLLFYSSAAGMDINSRANGNSVRCLKDAASATTPTVTTTATTDITQTTATGGGNITFNGGAEVTARGIVYSASENPTVATNQGITTNSIGTGQYASSLTGLTAATTYYVRAYATNSEGTAYGQQVSFTTLAVSSGDQTQVVEVTNPATGKTWMDRNLGASRTAISSTDSEAYGDLYQWGRAADGHEKRNSGTTTTLSSNDTPGHGDFITAGSESNYDWRNPQNDNLWQGVNGTNNPCPSEYRLPTEAEWAAERQSWSSNDAAGAFASPLRLPVAGLRYYSDGSLLDVGSSGGFWSSTVDGIYSRRLALTSSTAYISSYNRLRGSSVRCLKDATAATTATVTTTAITDITQTTVTSGGNITDNGGAEVTARGVVYSASENPTVATNQGITTDSIGTGQYASSLTGLTAATTYYVRAYATNSEGTAYGQQESFITLAESGGNETQVVEVTNPATGKTWMDRNLGASHTATSSADVDAYGDLYQWGRAADGHEKRNSGTTSALSTSDTPGHNNFILAPDSPSDWRSPQNDNLWQGVNGINNPCPSGYRLPTEAEWDAERQSWSSNDAAGAFASSLKLPVAGHRSYGSGSFFNVGSYGNYWSSTVDGAYSWHLLFSSSSTNMERNRRAFGLSVRCLKEGETQITTYTITLSANPLNGGTTNIAEGQYQEGEQINLGATPNEGFTFLNWTDNSDNVISTEASFLFQMPGENVTLTANFISELEGFYSLTLETSPEESGAINYVNGLYDEGQQIDLIASSYGDNIFLGWTDGDNNVVSTEASFLFTMPGQDDTLTANFYHKSNQDLSIIGEKTVCKGSEVIYKLNGANATEWEVLGGTIIEQNDYFIVIRWESANNGFVLSHLSDGSGSIASPINNLREISNPETSKPEIQKKGDIPILICTTPNLSYKWIHNGGVVNNENLQYYLPRNKSGEFRVQVNLNNNCPHTSDIVLVRTSSFLSSNMQVYPNPSEGQFTVNFESPEKGKGIINITNLSGKKVYSKIINKEGEIFRQKISVTNMKKGVYFISLQIGNSVTEVKNINIF